MAYDKNSFVLRGRISNVEFSTIGQKDTPLCKALIKVTRGENVQFIPIEAFGDNAKILSDMDSEYVQVEGQLKGREYEGKHYVSVNVWDVLVLREAENNSDPEPPKEDRPF